MVGLGLPPKYVLDEMEFYEIDSLLDSYYIRHKDSWEQARLIAYTTAQVNSRDKITPQDIMKFYWEKEKLEPKVNIDPTLIEKEMKEIEDILNNKSNGETGFSS